MLANNQLRISVRADFPFPPRDRAKMVYFEISILRTEHTAELDLAPPTVTLGFCGEFCDQTQAHPGSNVWSVGYHGDDGGIFEEQSRKPRYMTGRKFGAGDTVGCGIDYSKEEYFFTLNGRIVGTFLPKNFAFSDDKDVLIQENV